MDKEQVVDALKTLAAKRNTQSLRQKDIRTVPKLDYYISFHYGNIAKALEAAGLEPTPLAKKMATTNLELLQYLRDLEKKLQKPPTHMDIKRDAKYSEAIFRDRFGGLPKARKMALKKGALQSVVTKKESVIDYHYEQNQRGKFLGSAAENYVVSELLYRGYNASMIQVDLGLDIVAVKGDSTFYFQVKNVEVGKAKNIEITNSSFLNNQKTNVFYIFVIQQNALQEKKKPLLIIPFDEMRRIINRNIFEPEVTGKKLVARLVRADDKLIIYSLNDGSNFLDVTDRIDDWGAIPQ